MAAAVFFTLLSNFAATSPPLNGGFIQYETASFDLGRNDWDGLINRMDGLKMTTVIIQFLGKVAKVGPEAPALWCDVLGKKDKDPTRFILQRVEALNADGRPEERKIKVYLGLILPPDSAVGQIKYWNEDKLKAFAHANGDFAERVAGRYKGSSAFGGWYIPLENWVGKYEQGDEFPKGWHDFFQAVTGACKRQVDKPVAISPFLPFIGYVTPEDAAARTFAEIVKGTGVDIVMLQDSVGAKPDLWSAAKAAPCLRSLRKALPKGTKLWANLENFELQGGRNVPGTLVRFDAQIDAARGIEGLDQLVTFEFFYYMNGTVFFQYLRDIPNYESRMTKMYEGYKAKYVP